MKKIYILPNLITTGNFFSGMISIFSSLQGNFEKASLWILVAMLFDFLDGQVARLSKSSTKFGEEYDSLSDLVTFGIAPAILMFQMNFSHLGRVGTSIASIYAVSCALRLARFNAKLNGRHKTFFTGLPSPAAGGLIASSVLVVNHFGWEGFQGFAPFLMLFTAFLMISTVKYPSVHSFVALKSKGPFLYLACGIISLGSFIFLGEDICLAIVFFAYVIGGIILDVFMKNRFIDLVLDQGEKVEMRENHS